MCIECRNCSASSLFSGVTCEAMVGGQEAATHAVHKQGSSEPQGGGGGSCHRGWGCGGEGRMAVNWGGW